MMTRRAVMLGGGAALTGVFAYGVWRDVRPDPLAGRAMHKAGFSVGVPEGFRVSRRGGALILAESGDLRTPREITVDGQKVYAERRLHWTFWAPTRETAHGPAVYRLEEAGSGSGGTHWHLKIQVMANGFLVILDVEVQSEFEPDFGFAWQVVDSIT